MTTRPFRTLTGRVVHCWFSSTPLGVSTICQQCSYKASIQFLTMCMIQELEIRSVERGICNIATFTINERTVPIIMAGCMAHEREGYISTSGLKSDVTLVFLDPDFLQDAEISAIWP